MKNKTVSAILSGLAIGGVVLTAVTAARATPKALTKLHEDSRTNHDGDPNGYSKKEAVKSMWVFYVPTVVIGLGTIFCICSVGCINRRTQASLTSAYGLLNESYREYKDKLKELYGEEAHNKIIDEIAKEKARDTYIYAPSWFGECSLDFGEYDPNEERLFYDSFSGRYFESTINRVLQAEYHLNRNWHLGMQVTPNYFYEELLGISPIDGGEYLSWFFEDGLSWIDFNNRKIELEDGTEVLAIEFVFDPTPPDEY